MAKAKDIVKEFELRERIDRKLDATGLKLVKQSGQLGEGGEWVVIPNPNKKTQHENPDALIGKTYDLEELGRQLGVLSDSEVLL